MQQRQTNNRLCARNIYNLHRVLFQVLITNYDKLYILTPTHTLR
jgi:hypothetical protein